MCVNQVQPSVVCFHPITRARGACSRDRVETWTLPLCLETQRGVSRHRAVSRDTGLCLETQGCVSRHRAVSRDTALCLETQPGVSFTGFAGFAYILFNVVYLLLLSVNMVFVSNFIVFYVKKYPFTDLVLLPPIFPGSCEGRIQSV